MARLIEFPLENGGSVIIEASDHDSSIPGIQQATSHPRGAVAKATQTLESALDRFKPAAESILARLRSLSEEPNEIEVGFGLKVDAEVGAFIASGSVEANYSIRLKWTKEK